MQVLLDIFDAFCFDAIKFLLGDEFEFKHVFSSLDLVQRFLARHPLTYDFTGSKCILNFYENAA